MGYGIATAAGIQGGYDTLDHLLQQRMQQEAIKRQVAQQQFENQRQLAGDQRAQQAQTIEQQRYAAQMAERQGAADAAQGDKLNESIPGDTRLDPNDRAVGFLRSAGVPLQPVPGVAAMGADFQGPMPNGVTPQQAQTGIGAGFLKTASAHQAQTAADDQRRQSQTAEQQARDTEIARHNRETERITANKPAATVTIQTVDANGNPITKIVPKTSGAEFAKPANAATANRVATADTVNEVGADIVRKLSDPQFRATVGPAMGRYSTLRDFIGDPPPEFSELAGQIESYALANMGVHGMRSAQGAEQIKRLLDQRHTPESLAATIKGLSDFSTRFAAHNKPKAGGAPAAASGGARVYYDADGNPVQR